MSPLSRRRFLEVSASGSALLLGFHMRFDGRAAAAAEAGPAVAAETTVNAWLRISGDGAVTIQLAKSEMGQGIYSALPMIVADEMEADWSKVRVEQSPPGPEYRNPGDPTMITGGSSSVSGNWERLRQVGAAAREMLIAAAAKKWGVPAGECRAENGQVLGPGGKSAGYGELAAEAAKLPPPKTPKLKAPTEWKQIGKPVPRKDIPMKTDGTAVFACDLRLPGMLHAAVRMSPVFGGEVENLKALAVPKGALAVEAIPGGVAVLAPTWHIAVTGVEGLDVRFTKTAADGVSSDTIATQFREALAKKAAVALAEGDAEAMLKLAATKLEADYELPFLAHATMEPMSCVADVKPDSCEVWTGTQAQEIAQATAAQAAGLPPEKVKFHTTLLGGGFGRRFETDFLVQAVTLSKKAGKPVKVFWTREEDMQHDFYRPAYLGRIRGGLDAQGNVVAWHHRVVQPSIMTRVMPFTVKDGLDAVSVEGAKELPYAVKDVRVDYVMENTHVPVGFWRSVGSSQNAFAVESFVDELAHAAKQDPLELRRKLLAKKSPRHLAALELAAEKAGWGTKLPPGRGRGLAVHTCFGSYVAEVAEVTVAADGTLKVDRVVCAVDCGQVTNPDTIEAQLQSAVIFGLSAALFGAITIKDGRVEQSNWEEYEILRMSQTPAIEVHIVPSTAAPGGIGEPGTPPIAPAVANAIFAATGKRLRKLPFDVTQLRGGK